MKITRRSLFAGIAAVAGPSRVPTPGGTYVTNPYVDGYISYSLVWRGDVVKFGEKSRLETLERIRL